MEFILGYFLVLPWILLSLSNPCPVVGLKCYECTSEDPGCDTNVNNTGTKYIKDCDPRAIGCINWFIQYEFVFPRFLTRSCAFGYLYNPGGPVEIFCLIGYNYDYHTDIDKGYDKATSDIPKRYNEVIECLKKNRVEKGLPPPYPVAKNAPTDFGMLRYSTNVAELSNTIDVNGGNDQWGKTHSKEYKWLRKNHPNASELHCYSCDEDVPTEDFGSVGAWQAGLFDKITTPLPQCAATKRILCKKSYGCATLWEVRKEPESLSSRIWRGCWHPGDQFCLRRPQSKYGNASVPYSALGRTNGLPSEKNWGFNKKCEEAYAESRTTRRGSTVQWTGTIVKETEDLYNEYVQCRQNIRQRLGQDQLKNYSRNLLNMTDKPEGEDFFAAVRYIFCGFKEGCNLEENKDDPWQPPATPGPPEPEEPGPETGLGNCDVKGDKDSKDILTPSVSLAMTSLYFLYNL